MAGFRSPLPLLGLCADPVPQGGYASHLGLWMGGYGRKAGPQGGYNSLLAFWMGGYGQRQVAQSVAETRGKPFHHHRDDQNERYRKWDEDEDDFLTILNTLWPNL